jgi:hypothetical protein
LQIQVDQPDSHEAFHAAVVARMVKNRDSMSLGSSEESDTSDTSDSEVEDVQLVMEMEPSGSNESRPRPLSLSSSKKLSELCEYVSDDEVMNV